MSSLPVRAVRHDPAGEPVTEELRVGDWLGLAGYLANAVKSDSVTVDVARQELAGSVTDTAETRALSRAAIRAADQLGTDALVTNLLRGAAQKPPS